MRYRLLGPLEVTRDGDPIPLGGPKQRLVLAHLLIRANELVSAELLIDEIWGDEPPAAARQSLQSYVSNLRKALGADRLAGRPPGYVLRAAAEEIDVAQFEAMTGRGRRLMPTDLTAAARILRDALNLWQSEPLADLSAEPSLQPEIDRLSGLRLSVTEDLVEAELGLGRHSEQIPLLERLVARHPLRERPYGQLMLAFYRAGRQADALATYTRLRRALASELGVDPSPPAERLQLQILTQDPALELRGEPLRGYRLIGHVGSGPHGVVHRAFEPQTERDLAIKVLGARIANHPDFVRSFDAESRRIARIENPHVVPVQDWWREPDAAYLVMRLMPGGSLASRLAAGDVSISDAMRWAEQVGAALAAAHRHGLVHGDLHPGNILLDDDGNGYLSDFAAGYDPAGIGTGPKGARSEYLAPERQSGDGPSAAADIYALGVLLDALLDDRTPSQAGAALRETLHRATSAAPEDRQPSASDLVSQVQRIMLAPTATTGTEAVRTGTTSSVAAPPRNPYKGLRAFEEPDAADFAGREVLVSKLVARMAEPEEAWRLLAVIGPSGSGKSSVVNAGLIPALRSGGVSGSDHWFIATMTPGARPFERLERALLSVAVGSPPALAELLQSEGGLRSAVDGVMPGRDELLLVIHQFEELYTLVPDVGTREAFLSVLARTIEDPDSRVRVVITLRADFYDRPLGHDRFGRQLASRSHVVPPLTPEELDRVISEPAASVGLRFDRGLATRIVAEMSDHPGALPLLQYVLSELWERRDGPRLSLAAYDASGGISGAVARRAQELVQGLDPERREAARQLFLRLVEPGEGAPDTARRVRWSEVRGSGGNATTIESVVDSFARYRLLLTDRDAESREPTVQLAHEALLRAWPQLREWVDEARDDLRSQRRLAAAAAQWVEAERDPSFLLTGNRLDQTRAWAAATRVPLSAVEQEYLAASIAEADRISTEEEQRRAHERSLERRAVTRLRALVVTLGLGAMLAGGLSLFALSESQRAAAEARSATARELAAAAVANLEADPERSILLALAAIAETRAVDGTVFPEAEEALHRAVVASRVVMTIPGLGGDIDWSPDGTVFVTEGPENSGLVDIRDAATGESVRTWIGHQVDINDVTFSRDGSLLATAGDDGAVRIWDVATGEELAAMTGRPGTASDPSIARSPSFTVDTRLVAAAWTDENVVRILDLDTGEVREISSLIAPEETAFSPDGRWLSVTATPFRVVVLDVAFGTELMSWQFDTVPFRTAWSPDGRWLATGGIPVRIWDAEELSPEPTYTLGEEDGAVDVVWSADSSRLATASESGTATVWEVSEQGPRERFVLSSHDHGRLWGVTLSPDAERVMTAEGIGPDRQPVVKVWDLSLRGDAEWINLPADPGWTHVLEFTSDGGIVASSAEGTATVWDLESGKPELRIGPHPSTGAPVDPMLQDVAISPDGQLIATAGIEGAAMVWDAETGEELLSIWPDLEPEPRWIEDVAWSPDGEQLAVAANSAPALGSHVLIVDRSGGQVAKVEEDGVRPERIAFSPDGRLLAVAWIDLDTFALDAWRVTLWDRERGNSVRTIRTAARGVAFDPAGARLATVNDNGTAQIWDVGTGDLLATLSGHAGGLSRSISFSPDGTLVATAGEDKSVRLWDAESGRQRLVLWGHASVVARAVFSPDGSKLASTGADGVVRVWALNLDDLIRIARDNLTRGLTEDECRQFLHADGCIGS